MKYILVLTFIGLALAGCATTTATVTPEQRAAMTPEQRAQWQAQQAAATQAEARAALALGQAMGQSLAR